jgi:hypothetical protein
MRSLEDYAKSADRLAQEVVDAWRANSGADPNISTSQNRVLFNRACRYRDARSLADNHRKHKVLEEREEADEKSTRQAFAEAYKAFHEKAAHDD